ncbi:hypothetical protein HDU76_007386, partial [Blyttiomyces sp. JEL0837]
MNSAFGLTILHNLDSFCNLINLTSLSVLVDNGQSAGMTLDLITCFFPTNLKFLSLQISAKDLDLFGRVASPDRISINEELNVKECRIEVFTSLNQRFRIFDTVRTGFERLSYILPFDYIDTLRLVSGNNIWIFHGPEQHALNRFACNSRIHLPVILNQTGVYLESVVSSQLGYYSKWLDDYDQAELNQTVYENLVHLQLDSDNIKATMVPLHQNSRFYHRLQSFSFVGMPYNTFGAAYLEFVVSVLSTLLANCSHLESVLIHEVVFDYNGNVGDDYVVDENEDSNDDFFQNMMGLLVSENGLPKS